MNAPQQQLSRFHDFSYKNFYCISHQDHFKMKLLLMFFASSFCQFIDKKNGSQFLAGRSKCGDDCAKNKGRVSLDI